MRVYLLQSSKFTADERTVIIFDELYDTTPISDDLVNFKCCWAAAVEAGQVKV